MVREIAMGLCLTNYVKNTFRTTKLKNNFNPCKINAGELINFLWMIMTERRACNGLEEMIASASLVTMYIAIGFYELAEMMNILFSCYEKCVFIRVIKIKEALTFVARAG